MSTSDPPITFAIWCNQLLSSPRLAPPQFRSSSHSVDTDNRPVPSSIGVWDQFPHYVELWKAEMIACGLSDARFGAFAEHGTQVFTGSHVPSRVVGSEFETLAALNDYFEAVNDFNFSFYRFLEPGGQLIERFNQVYVFGRNTFGMECSPDIVITDGSQKMTPVGLGEVKTPWFVTSSSCDLFLSELPFHSFGEEFIQALPPAPAGESASVVHQKELLGAALVQLYSDLISAHLSVGFLATTDAIIYCCIPAQDRSRFNLCYCKIERSDRTQELEVDGTFMCTPQVGLATLAWLAKRVYSERQSKPHGLKRWGYYWSQRKESDKDPKDGNDKPRSSRSGTQTSTKPRPYEPFTRNCQYCTTLCLAALGDGIYHPDCPNAEYHKLSTFTVETVVEDVLEFISEGEGEVIGGGNSANCLAARSERFGHVLVVKAYLERTESWLFENEVKIYEHLKELQGLHIPLVLGTTYSIASGVIRPMIIMSYGGVSLDRCAVNDGLIDSIADALRALGTKDVYHEDFSLQNMLAQNNRAVVIDFESAQIRSHDPAIFEQYEKTIEFLCEWTKQSGDLRDFIL